MGALDADSPSPDRANALEFGVKVEPDGATSVKLQQGRLSLKNPQGEADLHPGEEGYVEPDRAPQKKPAPVSPHLAPPGR